ncbi:hypothetical protein ANO11243_039080 [Dothideomycetidae sp. 11243]|nr:hypothetical protein ANO11243_039080 [fungal sp. No.11243]
MAQGIQLLRRNGAFVDLTIECGKSVYSVHKVVVSAQSDYFMAALKDNRFIEGQSSKIVLPSCTLLELPTHGDNVPEAIESMLRYMYGTPDWSFPPSGISVSRAEWLVVLYSVSDKFAMSAWKRSILETFETVIANPYLRSSWSGSPASSSTSAFTTTNKAEQLDWSNANPGSLLNLIDLVYSLIVATEDKIKTALCNQIGVKYAWVLKREDFEVFCKKHNSLALDAFKVLRDKVSSPSPAASPPSFTAASFNFTGGGGRGVPISPSPLKRPATGQP